TATVALIRQDFFGKGDINAFFFWTLPLAIGLSVSGQTILNLFRTKVFLFRLLLILLTTGLISFGWIYFIYLILGPWINAFSLPIFYLWIIGNTVQLLFLDWRLPKATEQLKFPKLLLQLFLFPLTVVVTVIIIFTISYTSEYLT